ncbi:MAG: mechanosensitive ion channel family protein [Clostridia bacterium]|nr:mechanosensitive ion channel family protein [Clostridia bacterium]
MEEVQNIIKQILSNSLVKSIIIIILSIIIYRLLYKLILKKQKDNRHSRISNRNRTFLKVITSIVRYAFIGITIIIVLQVNGVNVDSILAGAGIIGIVIGFAVQDALKDIIRGSTILTDSYFQVGDVVKYGEIMGKVISIGLSTTKIEDIKTFNVISIANRNIEQIEVLSDTVDILVPLSYELPTKRAENILKQVVKEVEQIGEITNVSYEGVSYFKESNVEHLLRFHCSPSIIRPITRKVNGIILKVLERNNVEIPYKQIDIHQK